MVSADVTGQEVTVVAHAAFYIVIRFSYTF